MKRLILVCASLLFANPVAITAASEPVKLKKQMLRATDSEDELRKKLEKLLIGLPASEMKERLAASGAHNIFIHEAIAEDPPISAIFALRRGYIEKDRRLRVNMDLEPDNRLGGLINVEFYPK